MWYLSLEGMLFMLHETPTRVLGTIGKRVVFLSFWLLVGSVIWLVYVITFVGTTAGSVQGIEDGRVIVSFQLPNGDRREQAYSTRDASSEFHVGDSATVYCLPLIKGGYLYWLKGERWYIVAWKVMGGSLAFGIVVCLLAAAKTGWGFLKSKEGGS
jgi:hypothetical protein